MTKCSTVRFKTFSLTWILTMMVSSPIQTSEMLKELQSLRMIETHFGIEVKSDPEEIALVYDSLFVQFDRNSNGVVDLEEFKAETKRMMAVMANNLGFLPVQMILNKDSFLKKADMEFMKLQSVVFA
ncbi:hypothetical protein E3N88_09417 [Mikania micrantha]|uniref:EF-hand domain-containing protein n=1 Tax=Mikania micrantha TaxID=192012 RepID=A0A5N6PKY5_9ASTR|nr:hypothetical protein E3N88_09417 [Mikania micrantha]